jgi:hypothetical protein
VQPSQDKRPRILTAKEAVAALKERGIHRSIQTLAKYRSIGGGPLFVKIGGREIGYLEPAVHEYADRIISDPLRSTSDRKSVPAPMPVA